MIYLLNYNNSIFKLYKWSIFLLILSSWYAWMFNSLPVSVFNLLALIFAFIFILDSKDKVIVISKKKFFLVIILFITLVYIAIGSSINGIIVQSLNLITFSIIILLKNEYQIRLHTFITKSLAIILSVSLAGWILFLLNIPLPHQQSNFEMGAGTYNLINYYIFNARPQDNYYAFPRFRSIFLEPGHLGVLTAYLLFANKFEFKRAEVKIIFISALLTFSLAAYVLIFASLLMFYLKINIRSITSLITILILISTFYFYFRNKNESIPYRLIISRIEINDGDIAGNNRFKADFDAYYSWFLQSDKKYFGLGKDFYETTYTTGNAGYKVFIAQYGIIGAVLIFLLYYLISNLKKSRLSFIFLIICILSFLQRANPLRPGEIIIFILGITYLNYAVKSDINEISNPKKISQGF